MPVELHSAGSHISYLPGEEVPGWLRNVAIQPQCSKFCHQHCSRMNVEGLYPSWHSILNKNCAQGIWRARASKNCGLEQKRCQKIEGALKFCESG